MQTADQKSDDERADDGRRQHREADRPSPPRMRSGANSNSSVAQIVPLKQITEPDERSIPPAMITTAEPSAKMPNSDVCRMISRALRHGS